MAKTKAKKNETELIKEMEQEQAESVEEQAQTCDDAVTVEEEMVCLDDELSQAQAQIAELTEKLAEAEKQAAEFKDGWQRAQANFANFRKRNEAEQSQWRLTANAALLSRILPVLDDFNRAFDNLPEDIADNAWLSGIKLIQKKVQNVLDTESVKRIELKPGDMFDPMVHQAVVMQETEDFEDGQVMAVVQQGYILGERVLRPSMVIVAKAPAKPVPPAETVVEADVVEERDADADVSTEA